ncbi:MtrAB system histidine kinase MtrB [Tessaracoccus caeni]|uniref:MtrAB system histidine kinase MtrB n=1 Tax=Tessaracoccus caeni TaxID=3031239 RepID=UPI0023DC849D|nr:MtrAB system histidine kinase MtrB [Tessaracoccus caeni]MDF1488440.1 MtrAB system histidine kinase MtrB [Tessaracoccus caeni]
MNRANRRLRPLHQLWWSSLPLRVLSSTLVASMLVLVIAGVALVQVVTAGIAESKREASINEAGSIMTFMQQQLRSPEQRGVSTNESLSRLADLVSAQAGRYHVMIQAPSSRLLSTGMKAESVPEELRLTVARAGADEAFVVPTQVHYTQPDSQAEPGWVVGATLLGSAGEQFPVFFVFPMSHEMQVVRMVQSAVVATFVLLMLALGLVGYFITQQVVRPVRKASQTALKLASGDLGQRMVVRGTDDLALLAQSMNKMASDLQQRIQQLESLSSVQRRFVSDVSHELRTPMTTIKMAADMLHDSRHSFDPARSRSIELMSTEIDRFDALLADLLEISRIDAGAAGLALDEVHLGALVAVEVANHEAFATTQGVSLVLHDDGSAGTVLLDAIRVRRILRNLLANAIEHGEGRPVDITVAGDNDAVAVTVRDHGVGFPAEQAPLVFERFWRADPSRTRVVGGTGLGLAISLEDARLHNGWLSAWGRPSKGAMFRLTLPRDPKRRVTGSPLPIIPTDVVHEEAR